MLDFVVLPTVVWVWEPCLYCPVNELRIYGGSFVFWVEIWNKYESGVKKRKNQRAMGVTSIAIIRANYIFRSSKPRGWDNQKPSSSITICFHRLSITVKLPDFICVPMDCSVGGYTKENTFFLGCCWFGAEGESGTFCVFCNWFLVKFKKCT